MNQYKLRAFTVWALVAMSAVALADTGGESLKTRHRFRHLTIDDGLSQSSVHSLLQDQQGFIWVGTQDGLNRYDGTEFRIWKTDADAVVTLADPYVTCLVEDLEGNFWVGSETSGFGHFDTQVWEFDDLHVGPVVREDVTASNYEVRDLILDTDGHIWVATAAHGLLRYDPATRDLLTWGQESALGTDSINALLLDGQRNLLVATTRGLVRMDRQTWIMSSLQAAQGDVGDGAIRSVNALFAGVEGAVWLGTDQGLARLDGERWSHVLTAAQFSSGVLDDGLTCIAGEADGRLWLGGLGVVRYQPETGEVLVLAPALNDPEALQTDRIQSLLLDDSGVVWVGHDLGVSLLDTNAKRFYHLKHEVGSENTLSHNTVWGIHEDRGGKVWIATQDGVNIWDPESGRYEVRRADPTRDDRPNNDHYTMVEQDSRGFMWIGSAREALDVYDPAADRFQSFVQDSTGKHDAPSLRVYDQAEAPDGRIWQATYHGLQSYDPVTGEFTAHFLEAGSIYNTAGLPCKTIEIGPDGIIWLGTSGNGLWRLDPVGRTRRIYRHKVADRSSLCSDVVLALLRDSVGRLWVGTGAGLNRIDPVAGTSTRFTEKDGLPNNTIYALAEDGSGTIWASSNMGLFRLASDLSRLDHFQVRDGCQSNEFNMGAAYFGASGSMYFGGINGLNVFDPDEIVPNSYLPRVLITDFQINNQRVSMGEPNRGRQLLSAPIEQTRRLKLDHRDHVLSFSFASLHFAAPEKIRYQYMLDGFDSDWIEAGDRNHATYTNLPAGDYVFRVRATNSDGVWSENGSALAMEIQPPFWKTPWFLSLVGLLALSAVNGVIRYRTRLMKVRTAELEKRVTRRTADLTRANHFLQQEITERRRVEEALRVAKNEAEEATLAKSEFLANMSHEIRTPMNGVLGMTSVLLSGDSTPEQREHLEVVYSSAHNLLAIINDILDFSKIEAGKLELECIDFEPRTVVEEVGDMIYPRARDKNLRCVLRVNHDVPRTIAGDPVRLRQILVNLLNNAVKFTDEGMVAVRVSTDPEFGAGGVRLEVEDSGVGIPADRVESLWDSFSQVDTSTTREYGGTGLGLAICKQLVELMGGEIGVTSELGRGSCFWVRLPLATATSEVPELPALKGKVVLALAHEELNNSVAEVMRFLGLDPVICPTSSDVPQQVALTLAEHPDTRVVITGPWCAANSSRDVARKVQSSLGSAAPPCLMQVCLGEVAQAEEMTRRGFAGWLSNPMRSQKAHDAITAVLAGPVPEPVPEVTSVESTADSSPSSVFTWREIPLLLAEDNPVNQKVASILLRKMGYQVEVVSNGAEALDALARHRYRLVLMDVQMPVMDGYEAVRRIRLGEDDVLDPGVPIIALTAHAMKGDRQRCLDAGMDDYLAKPIDASALEEMLERFLGIHEPTMV